MTKIFKEKIGKLKSVYKKIEKHFTQNRDPMGIPLLEIIKFLCTYTFLMTSKEYNSVIMTVRKNN